MKASTAKWFALPCLVSVPMIIAFAQHEPSRTGKQSNLSKLAGAMSSGHSLLFTGTVREGMEAEMEAFFRDQILPKLGNSDEVKQMQVYSTDIGEAQQYVAILQLKQGVPCTSGTMYDIFRRGHASLGTCDALGTVREFQKFFTRVATSVISPRRNLSIQRNSIGFYTGPKE